MTFASLGLSTDLLDAVKVAGYDAPTSVQEKAIPLILQGKDLIVQAKTGTGKTASFALPVLQLLQDFVDLDSKEMFSDPGFRRAQRAEASAAWNEGTLVPEGSRRSGARLGRRKDQSSLNLNKRIIRALVLAPTRELALQVMHALKAYGRPLAKPLRAIALTGGLNIDLQTRNLHHGADIAVATPGRLLDLVRRGAVDLSGLKVLVIDEADKMFDLGFSEELEAVLKALPVLRQNLLFSATITEKVTALARPFMQAPMSVKEEDEGLLAEDIHQRAIEVNRNNRGPLLRHLVQTETWEQALIFVASVRDADILASKLIRAGISASAFHGGLTQAQRTLVLNNFKAKKFTVLAATDLAARGIDVNKLPVVVNYDLPRSPDDYIHRIGRTARAGEKGAAVTFIGHEDQAHFKLIEKRCHIRLPRESVPGFELTGEAPFPEKGKAPVKGHRMSKKDKARRLALKENVASKEDMSQKS